MVDDVAAIKGIRLGRGPSASENGASPLTNVVIAPAAGPLDEDETIEEDGIVVFVDRDIAPLLEDKLLDLVPAGSEQVQFMITDRAEP
jgi:Fe-S cluster assembly iron-binding protein IscA